MVKMVLGSSDAQGQTMSSVGKARIVAYNSAVTALSNFNGAGDLQGNAYDSGKQYGMSVITPLIKGAIMYSEYLSEAVPKLPSKYRSEVGGEDLDSAVLESEIQNLESSISSLRGALRAMEGSDHADRGLLQNISSRMDGLTAQKNEKMDKLRKLNLFAGSSNEVFSGEGAKSMDTVMKNLTAGLNMIHGDFASFGGTFPKHSQKSLSWVKSIEGEWDKKTKIDEDYQKVLEKIKDGKELSEDDVKAIQAYKDRFPGRNLPKEILQRVDAFKQKDLKEETSLSQNEFEKFKNALEQYCKDNNIDIENLKEDSLKDFVQQFMEEGPTELAKKAPEFYKFVSQNVNKAGAVSSLYAVLKTFSSTGNATTAGKVGNFIGNVFSKAKPFVQGTGKVFGDALTVFDFFDQLDSGENVVNAVAKTALHSYVSTAVTSTVTTSVAGGVGGTIGAFVGTLIPVPGVGTAIGYGLGLATGVAVSWAVNKIVDFAYDKTVGKAVNATLKAGGELVNNAAKGVKSVGKAIGDGVSGFFGGLGNAFGF